MSVARLPRIRDKRAQINKAALIKLASQIYRSNKLKAQERDFEEEGFIFNLHIKRKSFTNYKASLFNLENDEKTEILCMEADFQSDFLKTQTSFQNPKYGK